MYPGLVRAEGDVVVDGVVYFDINRVDIKKLDGFEGECYERVSACIRTEDCKYISCEVYVIKDKYTGLVSSEEWLPELFARKGIKEFLKNWVELC